MKLVSATESPQRLIAIDWSGRMDMAGQRKHIWAGVWTRLANGRVRVQLEAGRTRAELAAWLIELAAETPSMVVGIDACFSFPAWFLEEHGCADAFAFWRKVNAGLAEQWLARECEDVARDERFWGKPHKRPEQFCGEGYRRMFRFADYDNKVAQGQVGGDPARAAKMHGITAKSPFQIGGSGSVGTGSLRVMPMLERLREAGFRVWPFESSAIGAKRPQPLVCEMYTRLMTGAVAKSNAEARRVYLLAKRKSEALYKHVGRAVLQKALESEDAFDALVSVVELARHAEAFAGLKATRDAELRREGLTWWPGISA
ncbi:MAG: hypothetical protein PW735_00215 [Acidobacteriaceae bacterium]|nr:hypothetical protein [Acidobacteriaceae bacterium]